MLYFYVKYIIIVKVSKRNRILKILKEAYTMHSKTIPMTLEHAVSIANDMLDVLQAFIEVHPFFRLSQLVENGQTKYITIKFKPNDKVTLEMSCGPEVKDDFCLDLIYGVLWNGRYFRISFFDDPDKLGYCSMLPDYDMSTYVLCEMVEKRADGSTKHEMIFSFDIEKKTFLELFDISHYNRVDVRREYPVNSWNCPVEEALRDAIIL